MIVRRHGGVRVGAIATVVVSLLASHAYAAEPERVQITATDGVQLVGYLYGTEGPGIVFGHMYPADRRSWSAIAGELANGGFRALTLDFRGYGESGGEKDVAAIDRDMEGGYRYLAGRKIQPIFLVGASMGGTAAVIVGSRMPVAGVVTLSAPVEFRGLDASQAVTRVRAPKLFLSAEGDEPAAQAVARFVELAPDPKASRLFPGDAHGTDLFAGPQGGDVLEALRSFLAANATAKPQLPPRPSSTP